MIAGHAPRVAYINERGKTSLELTRQQVDELRTIDICTVQPGRTTSEWIIGDVRFVGNIALSGLRIVIKPKVPLRSILYMASVAALQVEVGDAEFAVDEDRSLPSAIAEAFVNAVDAAISKGMLKGYRTREETAVVVRGRWDVARQLRVRPGLPLPVELEIDDFTEDIDENRILHTALRTVLRLDGLPEAAMQRARRLLPVFSEVTMLLRGSTLPRITRTRLNGHLSFALFIADTILRSSSWTQTGGTARAGTFLINMASVFEGFIGVAMRRALAPRGIRVDLQDATSWRLDRGGLVTLRPDIMLCVDERAIAVADTKYKVWGDGSGSPKNPDIYQALAYALATGLPSAHLLYVSGDIEPRRYEITSANVTIVAHALSLDGEPAEIRANVDRLIEEMLAEMSVVSAS